VTEVTFWHWLILSAGLLLLEFAISGAYFLWMGLTAVVIAGLVALFPDMDWRFQVMTFSVLSLVSVVLWRRYQRAHPERSDHPLLNRRAAQYRGRHFTLDQPIENGMGRLRIDDTLWKISGDDCPAGTRVEVVGAEGTVLKVARLKTG
jgi:membrane protein implicated in regulation of membrane protease activity